MLRAVIGSVTLLVIINGSPDSVRPKRIPAPSTLRCTTALSKRPPSLAICRQNSIKSLSDISTVVPGADMCLMPLRL